MRLNGLFFCLAIVLAVLMPRAVLAQNQDAPAFETLARQAILMDAKSGHVFFEKDADTAIPPASMSKLMTQAIIFDMLKKGDLKLDQEMTVSTDAWKRGGAGAGGSSMFAEVNSRISVDNLLHGAIIQSANDACIVLAENIAGTEAAFAQRMNDKARDLGLKNSSYANATGLPDPGQRMSVRDLATLARYIILNHPDFYKIYGQGDFAWNEIRQENRNPLLKDYPGADGMKTGYTKEAGYGLVGSAQRDGRRLIMVVAGLDSVEKRRLEAQKLLDYGFTQFKSISVYESGDIVSKARVWGGEERWVNLTIPDNFRIALAPFEQDKAELKMTYSGPLLAPVAAGDKVGTVHLYLDGKVVAEQPLQAANDVKPVTSMWRKAADSIFIMVFGG